MNGPLVLKLGGELLESAADRARIAAAAGAIALQRPLVIVHGGGRAVDAELDRRGIAPKKIDGLRVTDRATLDAVVSVLGGTSNTELVAALVVQGVPAVGLTGVDAGLGRAARANAHRSTSGAVVDLGFVGDPAEIDVSLVELLLVHGYVPVIASLGLEIGDQTAALADLLGLAEVTGEAFADAVRNRDASEVAELLQGRGIAATLVADAGDIASDPQLWARGYFGLVERHLVGMEGTFPHMGPAWGNGPAVEMEEARAVGADSAEILG